MEEASVLAARAVKRGPVQWIPVDAALGRIVAHDLTAPFAIPSEARSRMDGYAVRAQDTRGATRTAPRELRCLDGVLAAGTIPALSLEPATACRILTGAVLPQGADAVVPDEDVERSGNGIRVFAEVLPGHWVSPVGEQMARGAIGVRAGTPMTASCVASAVAMGYARVPVFMRFHVALASTGTEILEPGTAWRPGASYADTRYLLAALAHLSGAAPLHLGCGSDDPSAIATLLDKAPGHAVVTTGGTGRGDKDFIFRVWRDLEIVPIFRGITMKPGGGTALGRRGDQLFWALPGAPWAAAAVFHELFVPMLETWHGSQKPLSSTYAARLRRGLTWEGRGVRAIPGELFVRGETLWFDPILSDSTHSLSHFAASNAYAVIPSGRGILPAETPVLARLFLGKGIAAR